MRQKIITFSLCMSLVLVVTLTNANAATCLSTGTYAQLMALGAAGCTLGPGDDKLFSNFVFAGSNGGTTATSPTAAQISYVTENPGTSTQTGQSVYGFVFNPGLAVVGSAASPNQIQDALLAYDITIVNPASGARITSIHLLETAAAAGGGIASVTETDIGCVSVGNCSTIVDNVSTVIPPGQHQDVLNLNLISLHVNKDLNVASGNVAGGFASISGVRDSVDQNTPSGVPEPSSVTMLLGGGLVLVGMLRRKAA